MDSRSRAPNSPRSFWIIALLYVATATIYGVVNPLFEAPDEHHHFFTAQWIADNNRLPAVPQPPSQPDFVPQQSADWLGQEAAQPPLYYAASGLILKLLPSSFETAAHLTTPNPFVALGDASKLANRNGFVHGPTESWPWRNHVLAAHLLRLLSTLIGAGTLWVIWRTGRLCWPDASAVPWLATALVGALPQFAFQHATISNDVLITFFASLVLYQLVSITLAAEPSLNIRSFGWLGILIGLAILTKTQGTVLLFYAIGFVFIGRIKKDGRRIGPRLLLTIAAALAVGGWLWVRNWILYGDPTAANQFVALAGGNRGLTLWQALAESGGIWWSFIAAFGWFNILPPPWVYGVWVTVIGSGILGLLGITWRSRKTASLHFHWQTLLTGRIAIGWMLAGWVLLVFASLVAFMMQTPAAQGRLLFPAVLPLALGIGWGLHSLFAHIPAQGRPFMQWGLVLALFAISLGTAIAVVRPAYALPKTIGAAEIPSSVVRLEQPLSDQLSLKAAEIQLTSVIPGEPVPLMLYWEKTTSIAERPEVVVEIFGPDEQLVGKWQGYHHSGLYPADLWPNNTVKVTRSVVETFPTAAVDQAAPFAGRIIVKLVDQPAAAEIGRVRLAVPSSLQTADSLPPLAMLGDCITLRGAHSSTESVAAGQTLTVTLTWEVTCAIPLPYTTLVHLGPADQAPLAQGDNQPLAGHYPTDFWTAGDLFQDRYDIPVPATTAPGRYPLRIGLYDAASPTFDRLPLQIDGVRSPDDTLAVAEIEIVP